MHQDDDHDYDHHQQHQNKYLPYGDRHMRVVIDPINENIITTKNIIERNIIDRYWCYESFPNNHRHFRSEQFHSVSVLIDMMQWFTDAIFRFAVGKG